MTKRKDKVEAVEEVVNDATGKTLAEFMDYALTEKCLGYKEATKYWKENKDDSVKRKGFREKLFNHLKTFDLDKDSLTNFIKENGSDNDLRNIKHYLAIAELVDYVRANYSIK